MYRGFQLLPDTEDFSDWVTEGEAVYDQARRAVRPALHELLRPGNIISADDMREAWFPALNADVFISHSHSDAEIAKGLVGWLDGVFGLRAFVDSLVWGYAPDLLRQIDNEFCLLDGGPSYDYSKRNRSTSHVHAILASALTQMLDKTECVIFLRTPQSIDAGEIAGEQTPATASPWIFHELAMTKWIRKSAPARLAGMEKVAKRRDESYQVQYSVKLDHLPVMHPGHLVRWRDAWRARGGHALDVLYSLL